ncbi:MAG: SMP-30/gluconolactonase/LRE family protein [Caldilineaceae bacterium]
MLNAPNDLCFDNEGRIYFTDPRYGYQHDLEQDCMAVYRIEHDGSLTRVITDAQTPNGILITPDNQTIYLVDHNPEPGGARTLLAYDLDGQGQWQRREVLHDFGDGYGGDGMVLRCRRQHLLDRRRRGEGGCLYLCIKWRAGWLYPHR